MVQVTSALLAIAATAAGLAGATETPAPTLARTLVAPVEVTTCVEIKFRAPHAIDAMVSP